jgi:DNA-directed RNA polymerase subunit RPC12/RpoP
MSENGSEPKLILMKCKACGATVQVNSEQTELICPYCKSKELILDSDAVKAEKVRSQAYVEVEKEKLKHDKEMNEASIEENEINEFKKGKGKVFLIIFAAIFAISSFVAFKHSHSMAGVIAILQTAMLIASFMIGMHYIKVKMKWVKPVLTILAFLMIFPYYTEYQKYDRVHYNYEDDEPAHRANKKLKWPTKGLAAKLPDPESKYGYVNENDSERLSAEATKYSHTKYKKYLAKCKEKGFTDVLSEGKNKYTSCDTEGNTLDLYFENSAMNIELTPAYGEIKWPTIGLATMLPVPKSTKGEIESDNEQFGFDAYVGGTTQADYAEYVSQCQALGFVEDYDNETTEYTAKNKDGYSIRISITPDEDRDMEVEIQKPKKTKGKTSKASSKKDTNAANTSNASNSSTTTDTSNASGALVDGMRPEFKTAIDSYEAFFNEYVDFMKKYSANPTDAELIKEYSEYMTKYNKAMEDMGNTGKEKMNDAETAYYLAASNRINTKLLEVATQN